MEFLCAIAMENCRRLQYSDVFQKNKKKLTKSNCKRTEKVENSSIEN